MSFGPFRPVIRSVTRTPHLRSRKWTSLTSLSSECCWISSSRSMVSGATGFLCGRRNRNSGNCWVTPDGDTITTRSPLSTRIECAVDFGGGVT